MISKKVLAGVAVRKEWTPEDIRNLCIDRGLYTKGTKEEYEEMLQYVADNSPVALDIEYTVARDILDHTDPAAGQTIENIMFLVGNKVVKRIFEDIKEIDPKDRTRRTAEDDDEDCEENLIFEG